MVFIRSTKNWSAVTRRRHLASRRLRPEMLEDRALLSATSLDPTFGSGGKVITDIGASTSDFGQAVAAYQSDGKLLVTGTINLGSIQTGPDFVVVRYNSDGSLDTTFGTGGKVLIDFGGTHDFSVGIAVDSQGRIIVAGESYQGGPGTIDFAVARLTRDGLLDTSFSGDGKQTIDFGGTSDTGRSVAVDSLDRIVITGFNVQGGESGEDFAVARLTADGALDASFDADGKQTIDFGGTAERSHGVAIDSQDRVLVSGVTWNALTGADYAVARLTSAGAPDTSFDFDGRQTIDFGGPFDHGFGVAVDSQDRVLVSGQGWGSAHDFGVARLTTAGALDISFSGDGKQTVSFTDHDRGFGVTVDSLDRVLITGWTPQNGTGSDFCVARLTSAGELDTSFEEDGKKNIDFGNAGDVGVGIAVDSQGRIALAGYSFQGSSNGFDFAVARLTGEGALDTNFDADGRVTTNIGTSTNDHAFDVVAYQPDGKFVVVGDMSGSLTGVNMIVVRYNSDGTLDFTFGSGGKVIVDFGGSEDWGTSVAVDSQGRIVVVGYSFRGGASGYDFAAARLNSDGSLDTSFDGDGKQTIDFGNTHDQAYGVALDSLDRIIISGQMLTATGFDFAVARLTSAGALDTSFGFGGKQAVDFGSASDVGLRAVVDSLDRVLVVGRTSQNGANNDFAVVRLTSAGVLDTDFGADGKQVIDFGNTHDWGNGLALDSHGRIVVAGYTAQGGATGFDFALARLTSDGALDASFDADGKRTIDLGTLGDFGLDVEFDSVDRIVVAGYSQRGGTTRTDFALVRLASDGALDTSFDSDGITTTDFGGTDDLAFGIGIDPQNRIVVAGYSFRPETGIDFAVARYVTNRAPVADAGGPYSVGEGGSVALNASGTSDPDPGDTLTYAWDLDGDGIYGETGAAAGRGDETGINPVLSAAGLDGPVSITVSLRVTDAGGLASTDTAIVSVTNVAPQNVAISGPASGVRGQTRTFTGTFTDPGVLDTHAQNWEVRDAAGIVVATAAGSTFDYTPVETGSYTVTHQVIDDDGGAGSATHTLIVHVVELQSDPCHPSATALAVGGTAGDDHIQFGPGPNAGEIEVKLNGLSLGVFSPTGSLLAFAQAGDDDVQVAGSITLAAWLYGGLGSDRLKGGGGNDVLIGEEGDDLLVGGSGRDLLIGGTGADRIVGNPDDDILIAGSLLFADEHEALCAVMAEWTSPRDYETRVKNLSDGSGSAERLNANWFLRTGSTVLDDDSRDVLTGSDGLDWFFLAVELDRATDLNDEAFANDLDWILGS